MNIPSCKAFKFIRKLWQVLLLQCMTIFCHAFLRLKGGKALYTLPAITHHIISSSVNTNINLVGGIEGSETITEYLPPEVTWEIYVGSIVAILPIVWASYEFYQRIRVQRECLICKGSGLIYATKLGAPLKRARKCWNCGGFLPWINWKYFFFSTFFDAGNGGILQRPAKDYELNNEKIKQELSSTEKEASGD
jgi:hypothetical protein